MGNGWRVCLRAIIVSLIFITSTAKAIDSGNCDDWMVLHGLKEILHRLTLSGVTDLDDLKEQIKFIEDRLNLEPTTTANDDSPPMLITDWTPEEGSGYQGEVEEEGGELWAEDPVGKLFLRLTEVVKQERLSTHPEIAIQPVFRRMIADKQLRRRPDLIARVHAYGIEEPQIEGFAFELWNYRIYTESMPEDNNTPQELRGIALLLNMDPEAAIRIARGIDYDEEGDTYGGVPRAFYYAINQIARERLDVTPKEFLKMLEQFKEHTWKQDTRPFGRMLYAFLQKNDPLNDIHSVETLEKFLELHVHKEH